MAELTHSHRANLEKLATYLEKLPKSYEHFDMKLYHSEDIYDGFDRPLSECGAVACALGHGPIAGIPLEDEHTLVYDERESGRQLLGVRWATYGRDSFTAGRSPVWHWLFDGQWDRNQPTHRDAAARIWYFLDNGKSPEGWSYKDDRWAVY